MIRRAGWLLGVATLVTTGAYTVVYLYRWEWNRALVAGIFFVAIEVGMAASLVLRRLARLERRIGAQHREPAALDRVQEAAGPHRDHFAWLEPTVSRTNVFITVLLGAGVVLSAMNWLVDRIASRSASASLERGLARRLDALAFAHQRLVPDDAELLAQAGPYVDDPRLRTLLGPHP